MGGNNHGTCSSVLQKMAELCFFLFFSLSPPSLSPLLSFSPLQKKIYISNNLSKLKDKLGPSVYQMSECGGGHGTRACLGAAGKAWAPQAGGQGRLRTSGVLSSL